MAKLKEVKNKISAVKKTRQITKAMNMVAASRLRGAQSAMVAFRPYASKFAEVLGSLAGRAGEDISSPLIVPREEVKKVHIVLCTSDRGLCGGFNTNLVNKAGAFVKEQAGKNIEISFTNFGKKGRNWCRKMKFPMIKEHLGIVGSRFGFNVANTSGREVIDGFLRGDYDEVYLIYAEFVSMARQIPRLKQLLPIPPLQAEEKVRRPPGQATWPNISASLLLKKFWGICFPEASSCNCIVLFWRRRPVNMPRAWPPWTMRPRPVTT